MKAKLIVEGKEFEININHPELEKLSKPEKKTGYERAKPSEQYWFENTNGEINKTTDFQRVVDAEGYKAANYYSNITIAENNARADKLMRQLRRFAVEHREEKIDWNNRNKRKWNIYFDYSEKDFFVNYCSYMKDCFGIYFDSEETAKLALKTFHDELIWYFTEYKDSL